MIINVYLSELLENYNKYKSKTNVIKAYPEYSSEKDIELYSKISRDLDWLCFCIDQLTESSKKLIKQIYFDNLPLSRIGKDMYMSKEAVYKRKVKALRELEELFEM